MEAQTDRSVAIVGAGLMGSGIAQVAAVASYDVVLHDVSAGALEGARSAVDASLHRLVEKGRISTAEAAAALARIRTTSDLDECGGAACVVEAVTEDVDVKSAVFGRLDAVARADAVLATNTSAIPVTRIAAVLADPSRCVGTHFFSPVPVMPLCELVRGLRTSDAALATARGMAEDWGKTCVVVERDVAGFVTTRLLVALTVEAIRLVETGVISAEDLDTACRLGFGHAMGPLATADLAGLDVVERAARNIYAETADPKFWPPELLSRLVAVGALGRKSGAGFHPYTPRTRP